MTKPSVALTGASGFIGHHLLRVLLARGYDVRALLRQSGSLPPGAAGVVVGDLRAPRDLASALAGIDVVVHAAGLAHQPRGVGDAEMFATNATATLELAKAAQKQGVRRFVFVSSLRAQTGPSAPHRLAETTPPNPTDAYGRAKLAAERGLAGLDIEWAALRPVLVYGRGAQGNLASLLRLARLPLPLPFGAFEAPRSLVGVDSVVAAVVAAIEAPGILRRPFLVADTLPVSLADIITALRRGLGRPPNLLAVSPRVLRAMMQALGRGDMAQRLLEPLEVDATALTTLGWQPTADPRPGLERWARHP
ncbi:MAG: NAD-dependent epimerase/dehydratase family protein [Geminicoccaceae bacterium]|nr:MAG: NAD-dependent epimerase/dehydratase family protein [Geminicoccaceae bacterium]